MAHASNIWVVRVFKLVDDIDFTLVKDYKPVEVFVDLENSDTEDFREDF